MQTYTVHTPIEWLGHRLSAILMALQPLIARHLFRHPSIPQHVIAPLHNRITRYAGRLARLIALYDAGRLPTPRERGRGAQPATARTRQPLPIPRRRGWMLAAMGWRVAHLPPLLESLLAMPEAAGFLAASPAAGRMLRPMCHMLGVDAPLLRRPRAPRGQRRIPPPATARPAPTPMPALPPGEPAPLCPRLLTRWPWARPPETPAPRLSGTPLLRLAGPPLTFPLPG